MRKERLREWYVLGGILTTQLLNGVYFFHSWLDRFQRLDQVATLSSAPTLSFGINSFCQERANHWQVIIWCCHLWKSALGTFDLILPTIHWQGPSIRASHRWGMWDPHGYTSNEQQTAGLTRSPHSVLSTVSGGGGMGEPLGVSERHLLFHGFTKEQDSWKHFLHLIQSEETKLVTGKIHDPKGQRRSWSSRPVFLERWGNRLGPSPLPPSKPVALHWWWFCPLGTLGNTWRYFLIVITAAGFMLPESRGQRLKSYNAKTAPNNKLSGPNCFKAISYLFYKKFLLKQYRKTRQCNSQAIFKTIT